MCNPPVSYTHLDVYKRQNERMESSVEAYSNAKNDLESVNQELEETQSKMDALTSKGGLTFVEQGQLEDLRAATEELRVQQKWKEKEVEDVYKRQVLDVSVLKLEIGLQSIFQS